MSVGRPFAIMTGMDGRQLATNLDNSVDQVIPMGFVEPLEIVLPILDSFSRLVTTSKAILGKRPKTTCDLVEPSS